jgi:membrane-bound metal-dependent hydrolase YbcI (DUF457 family)
LRGLIAAAACLPVGFGVAAATGIRPLGGIVLLVLALLAVRWSARQLSRQIAWLGVVLACFIASHLLADATGAWGAVAIVAAVATGAYVAILRRPSRLPAVG